VPIGDVISSISLLDAGGQSLGTGMATAATISFGGEVVPMGPVAIVRD